MHMYKRESTESMENAEMDRWKSKQWTGSAHKTEL